MQINKLSHDQSISSSIYLLLFSEDSNCSLKVRKVNIKIKTINAINKKKSGLNFFKKAVLKLLKASFKKG